MIWARASGSTTSRAICWTAGRCKHYIDELSVTGLTSNPTIFDHAIRNSATYDAPIRKHATRPADLAEDLFFDLALEDLTRAADLFRPIFERTGGVDGWVSLEVSPLLAHDTASTLAAARALHDRAGRPNLFIKIPGTPEGLPAIEEATFAGIPVNVTLLFSREQYLAAAEAYLRGVERRIAAGLNPAVASVASRVRQPVGCRGRRARCRAALVNRLGDRDRQRTYKAYHDLLGSARWHRAANAGARAQRLLWASTGTKDPKASDILYVKALAAPFTVNTMPEATLKAFADHGEVGDAMPPDGGDCRGGAGELRQGGHRRRRRWPPGCRTKERNPLSNPGRSDGVHRFEERGDAEGGVTELNRRRTVAGWSRRLRGKTMTDSPLHKRPPGLALKAITREIEGVHLRQLFAEDASARGAPGAGGRGHLSRLFEEPHHRRDLGLLLRLAEDSRACASASTPCSAARRSMFRRARASACRAACATRRVDLRRRPECRARGARRARQDGRASPTASAAATGKAIPANASAT